jgi:hypothetical protein
MRQNLGSTTTIYGIGYSNFGKRSLKFAASDQSPGEPIPLTRRPGVVVRSLSPR